MYYNRIKTTSSIFDLLLRPPKTMPPSFAERGSLTYP